MVRLIDDTDGLRRESNRNLLRGLRLARRRVGHRCQTAAVAAGHTSPESVYEHASVR